MKILFLDCTNYWLIIQAFEIVQNEILERYSFLSKNQNKKASESLILELEQCLKTIRWNQFDRIVVCLGPGSFTSSRICVSTGRNLAQIWKVPILGVNSLEFYGNYFFHQYNKSCFLIFDQFLIQKKFLVGKYFNDRLLYSEFVDLNSLEALIKKENPETIFANIENILEKKVILIDEIPSANTLISLKKNEITQADLLNFHYNQIYPLYMQDVYTNH